jgi:hypothetical protein
LASTAKKQPGAQARCRPAASTRAIAVGVCGVAQPGAVAQHRGPLRGGEAHLRGELAGLFHAVVEFAREVAVEEHHGLGGEQAVLGAAESRARRPRRARSDPPA